MLLRECFEEIESFEFGSQFTIFSGFSLVLSDMSENETLQNLVDELQSDRYIITALIDRINQLLENPQIDNQIAFDGSLASYLYCLWKADIEAGYFASQRILDTADLWWSAKLALLVRKEYLAEQISNSLNLGSQKVEPFAFLLTGPDDPVNAGIGQSSYLVSMLVTSPNRSNRLVRNRDNFGQIRKTNDSWLSFGGQMVEQKSSNPTQEFEILTAQLCGI